MWKPAIIANFNACFVINILNPSEILFLLGNYTFEY